MNTTDKIMALADALSDADFELARINSHGGDTTKAVSAAKAAQDKLRAEIEALVDSNAAKADRIDRLGEMVEKLKAENDALVRDAERYRALEWVQEADSLGPIFVARVRRKYPRFMFNVGLTIDAAMQEKQS